MDAYITDRLFRRFEVASNGCWEWQGSRNMKGYGQMKVHGKVRTVHRLTFEVANGSLPAQMFVCHRCDNPPCMNPAHLFLGTASDNNRDAARKGHLSRRARPIDPEGIRLLRADGMKLRDVASALGISLSSASKHGALKSRA